MYGYRQMYKKNIVQTAGIYSIVGMMRHTAGWQKYFIENHAGWQTCQLPCK